MSQAPDRAPGPLRAAELRRRTDPEALPFSTTSELEPLDQVPWQPRATEAVSLGLAMRHDGNNVFALGPPGIGKRAMLLGISRARAANEPPPGDWVYVNNFATPHRPQALSLPPGRGAQLKADMRNLVEELKAAIPAALETEDMRTRRQLIDEQLKAEQEQAFGQVQAHANERHIGIIRTPMGMGLAPVRDGNVIGPEDFQRLPPEDRQRIQSDMAAIQDELQQFMQHVPEWESRRRQQLRELERQVIRFAIAHLIGHLEERHKDLPEVLAYLSVVRDDLVENAPRLFLRPAMGPAMGQEGAPVPEITDPFAFNRYEVNLIVDRSGVTGAPVVEEDHPTFSNLVGRIEYRPQFGALVTDFTLIKAGALHRANGGYLLLDARRLLMQPFAWDQLKRALRTRQIRIETAGEALGMVTPVTLEPMEVPLDVKVILTGDAWLYYLLCAQDPDFRELFRIAADFDERFERTPASELAFARVVAGVCRREGMLPLDRTAVARTIEQAARNAEDSERLSSHIEGVVDLLREANHYASGAGRPVIGGGDVAAAVAARERRASRLRERALEQMLRSIVLIDTDGAAIGQVNGLSVVELGGFAFGRPTRISARVRLGKGEVIDIERQVELGGPIHSKGVMILSGLLGERFARGAPLSLSASLVFEQSYGGVEGDSASMAEFSAIVSALARVPIRQGLAITGSVNQHGHAQPIGGVNQKIEGFFDLCAARGLTGGQGVIIPASNRPHLMLREDVVGAVEAGRFAVHAVETVDQAVEILTGEPAGVPDADGRYPPGTVNGRAAAELAGFLATVREFAASGKGSEA